MRVTKCLHRPVAHCPVMGGVPGNDRNMDLTLNPPQDPAPKVGYDYVVRVFVHEIHLMLHKLGKW